MSHPIVQDDETAVLVLSLMHTKGVGSARVASAIQSLEHRGVLAVQALRDGELLRDVLTAEQIQALARSTDQARKTVEELSAQGIKFLSCGPRWRESGYPKRLLDALGKKAPPLLTCLGNTSLLSAPAVGFCGSRKASERGLEVAADCSEQLAREGITIVSGYATGVDLACHTAALRAGGATAIVLAEGISHFRIKQSVRDAWDWDRAVIVSEYVPSITWTVSNAMQRNKTIVGLSDAMILIEAGETGGSIAAGRECLAMNHPLFAPVYDGMPPAAIGNRIMLGEGAYPLHRSKATGRANMVNVLHTVRRVQEGKPVPRAPRPETGFRAPEPSPSPPPVSAVLLDVDAGRPAGDIEETSPRAGRRRRAKEAS